MKYIDSPQKKKTTGIYAPNFSFSFRDTLKPVMDTYLKSKLESLSVIWCHVKTIQKPLFTFCAA